MKIAIVGWGLEARSAYRFFGPEHDYLIVNEARQEDFPAQTDKVKVRYLERESPVGLGGQIDDLSYLEGIDKYDKIVYQPTSYFNLKKVYGEDRRFWDKATTAYDIFFEHTPTKNIIGVTGTKGKGTTSTLIAKMLASVFQRNSGSGGPRVFLGGNIGTPILDLLPELKPDDWVVWEMANFQLKPASYSPHVAVCLMIAQEHLDWHPDMDDYVEAKGNLFRHQEPDDLAIYFENDQNSKRIAGYSPGQKIPYFHKPGAFVRADRKVVIGEAETEVISLSDIKLPGEHNLENICAAVTAVWFSLPQIEESLKLSAAHGVLVTFGGLEHRLEFVREIDGVLYYDDSFGTNPDTTIVALKALIEPVVLILGGYDKGLDYTELINQITSQEKVRHIITIGDIGPKLAEALRAKGYSAITEGLSAMPDIVAEARAKAKAGDAVLLSCGTSSFGLFKDYKERGNQFKSAVDSLRP